MLEIGADFDDSLFEEVKKRKTETASKAYHVKSCDYQWYQDVTVDDPEELHNVYKYRGDLAYYHKQYEQALSEYNDSLKYLAASNTTVWRDIQEARVRCLMLIGNLKDAQHITQQVVDSAVNFEQKSSALWLAADVSHRAVSYKDELEAVRGLAILHPTNPDVWLRLAAIYTTLHQLELTTCPSLSEDVSTLAGGTTHVPVPGHDVKDDTDSISVTTATDRVLTCLLWARLQAQVVQNTIGSFAKNRNADMRENIDMEIEKLNVQEDTRYLCQTHLGKCKREEDELVVDGAVKLEWQRTMTEKAFDLKWFSWAQDHSKVAIVAS